MPSYDGKIKQFTKKRERERASELKGFLQCGILQIVKPTQISVPATGYLSDT